MLKNIITILAVAFFTDTSAQTLHNIPTYGGMGSTLHQGLNTSIGLSVMTAFGKNAPKGAGFAQNISTTYLAPVGKKGWAAVGGYINHLNWDGANITNSGLYAEFGYKINEHWAAYIYGQKSLANSGMHCHYGLGSAYGLSWQEQPYCHDYGFLSAYNPYGDKLGAALQWMPSSSFSLQISVEKNWYQRKDKSYNRLYDYQK